MKSLCLWACSTLSSTRCQFRSVADCACESAEYHVVEMLFMDQRWCDGVKRSHCQQSVDTEKFCSGYYQILFHVTYTQECIYS